jgi:hypothetical protein
MVRLTRMGAAALLAVVGLALTAGAADKAKKKPDPVTYNVTAKDISEEFAKKGKAAERKYQPAPVRGAPAIIDMDGYVKSVDDEAKTVTLESNPKALVVLKAKKISGEKEGKRVALAKKGKFIEFNAKDKTLVFEFDEVMLQKLPE